MLKKVKKYFAIYKICVSLTDFPEHSSVLLMTLLMVYHFEPDNDFTISCIREGIKVAKLDHGFCFS
jgi:hypothetical protein